MRATSAWFSAAAHIRAVSLNQCSRAFTSAPALSSAITGAGVPVLAAVISAVSPSGDAVSGSAPEFSSSETMAALPLTAASESGATP